MLSRYIINRTMERIVTWKAGSHSRRGLKMMIVASKIIIDNSYNQYHHLTKANFKMMKITMMRIGTIMQKIFLNNKKAKRKKEEKIKTANQEVGPKIISRKRSKIKKITRV